MTEQTTLSGSEYYPLRTAKRLAALYLAGAIVLKIANSISFDWGTWNAFVSSTLNLGAIACLLASVFTFIHRVCDTPRIRFVVYMAFVVVALPEITQAFADMPYIRHLPFIGTQGAMHGGYKNLFSVASVLLLIISFFMALMELFRAKARAEQTTRALAHEIEEHQRAEEARLQMFEKVQAARKFESLAMAAGAIAHNFNNIQTIALGNADLALLHLPADNRARANIEAIRASIYRSRELTQQMLALAGGNMFQLAPTCVSRHLDTFRPQLLALVPPNIELRFNVSAYNLVVNCAPDQIVKLTTNLIANAVEAIGGKPGVIAVHTGMLDVTPQLRDTFHVEADFPGDKGYFIRVEDNGAGMDKDTAARIFEPFFTTRFIGRGLGLPVALGIVRAHQGNIAVKTAPEEGTVVTVVLPLAEASEISVPA